MAYDVGGIPEVLEGGEAGVLVPAHLLEQLVAALMELIDNPDRRFAAGSNLALVPASRHRDHGGLK